MYNTTVVIDPTGEIIARYSKIHMYDVVLDGVAKYQESATVTPGDETAITEIDGIPVGLTICYDLRFPELFRILALKGAQAIVLPAAFTLMTGKDHWETLIRARAIENELYMIAPGQWGTHRQGSGAMDGRWSSTRGALVTTAPTASVSPTRPSIRRVSQRSAARFHLANRRPEAYTWPEESRSSRQGASRSDPARSTERDQDRRSRVRGDPAPGVVQGGGGRQRWRRPQRSGCHRHRGPSACSDPGEQQRYIVREGDTLSGIAARFGVSEDAILKENPSPIAIASSSGRNW